MPSIEGLEWDTAQRHPEEPLSARGEREEQTKTVCFQKWQTTFNSGMGTPVAPTIMRTLDVFFLLHAAE
jgi:hypothetical protein